jgi:hypothetical protein
MIKVPYSAFPMQVVYSASTPAFTGKIEWKAAAWLTEEDRDRANEWLAERFGKMPYMVLFEKVLVMHPCHQPYIQKLAQPTTGETVWT